jgi:hypothetical protein
LGGKNENLLKKINNIIPVKNSTDRNLIDIVSAVEN